MNVFTALVKRNVKLYFKDKGMFFSSLITPMILLVLYGTFLKNVYEDSFMQALKDVAVTIPDKLINGVVAGEICSSILAVSCVTVAFCSNMLMVQDKANGSVKDFLVAPVKKSTIALSYYVANLISTLIVCYVAMILCFIYIAACGWYLSVSDVLLTILCVFLVSLFGCALSSIINSFLSTQGQISAVGTIVSSGYGFICGAYMPLSQFSQGLRNVISFLPGTYGTSMIRNAMLQGTFKEFVKIGFPADVITSIKDSIDCNLYFFNTEVSVFGMYMIIIISNLLLIGVYVLINALRRKKLG